MGTDIDDARLEESRRYAASIDELGERARTERIARGEIMTYLLDGWVVREFPGGRIEKLAPLAEFRAADFPYPSR